MTKARTLAFLVIAIALILIILALQLIAPGEKSLHETIGDASITFTADRRMVAAPGGCVTVHWQVEYIEAVYINGEPTVGEGERDTCVTETTMPVLRVEFTGGAVTDYTLTIDFLIFQPSTWLLVSAAILLGLASLYVVLTRPAPAARQTDGRRTPRSILVFAGIGMLVTGLVITALILELALRFYFGNYGSRAEQDAYIYSRAEIEAREDSQIPLPFVEYGLSPDFPGQNTLGYRGDEIQVPKPDGVYRIVVLGNSTTYGTFVPYNQTFPYDLQTVLRDDYHHQNLEVVNGGVPGYTSWNTFVSLALRVTELQPDLVIVYEGGNDVLPREVPPDCYSAPSPFLGLDPRRQLRAQPGELSPSALYRFIAANLGWTPDAEQLENGTITSRVGCSSADKAAYDDYLAANAPTYFERNLRDMIGVADANGIRLMFLSWAYELADPEFTDAQRAAVSQHNAITARVAQENGALYLDYAAIAPTEKRFWNDNTHLTAEGNLGQAQAIAQFLDDHDVIDAQTP